jgi:hypothetical protein
MSGQFHAPADLLPGERAHVVHLIERWVGPRSGVDFLEKTRDEMC